MRKRPRPRARRTSSSSSRSSLKMSCWNSYDVISDTAGVKVSGRVQEATRASRGLAHRWALGAAVTAVVRCDVEMREHRKRVKDRITLDRVVTRSSHLTASNVCHPQHHFHVNSSMRDLRV